MKFKGILAVTLLSIAIFAMADGISIVTANHFDWASVTDSEDANKTDANNTATTSTTKKQGNGFVRALGAPFRAIGRLFGGGKKNNQQARRITKKEAAKFETAKVTRIKDATIEPDAPSSNASVTAPSGPSNFDAHLLKGRELLVAGNLDEAIAELSTAASLNPRSTEVHNLLGIAFEGKGLRDRALQSFEVAIHSDENNAEHFNNLGYLLYKNGEYERATKYLKRAAKLKPTDSRIWNNLALTQVHRGQFDDANQSFAKAFGEFSGHMNVAAQLQIRGYAKDATKHLEKALALQPNSVEVLTKLAAIYDLTGRPTDAESARRSLVALKTFADANK